jgi:hypothetical protein
MTSSLIWKPVVQPESHYLGDQLKFILRKKYGNPVDYRFDISDIAFLEGIVLSGSHGAEKEAQILINLIEKHDKIDVVEEY